MIGTGYSFFFQESHSVVQEYVNTDVKTKEMWWLWWWMENNRNVKMQKGRRENEERSFLVTERDSLPSCSFNMHDLCAKNQ